MFPSISAVEDSYEVQAVMDACGSPFEINEIITRERLKAGGVSMTVTNAMVAKLVGDWSTKQEQPLVPLLSVSGMMQPVD